jgi:hypothetical protein
VSYEHEDGKYGFKKDGEAFIQPKFNVVFPFTSKITTVADSNWRYGILDFRGKWYKKPTYDLISPVVNFRYIVLSGDQFRVYNKKKILKTVLNPFDIDYKVFRAMIEKSDMADKNLIIRVIDMSFDGNHHHDLTDIKKTLSKTILSSVWGTKWIIDQIL